MGTKREQRILHAMDEGNLELTYLPLARQTNVGAYINITTVLEVSPRYPMLESYKELGTILLVKLRLLQFGFSEWYDGSSIRRGSSRFRYLAHKHKR